MRKIIYIVILGSSLLFAACGDFLNESPRHKWDVDKAMTTYSNAQQAVNGIYGQFMTGDHLNMGLSVSYNQRAGLSVKEGTAYELSYTQKDSPGDAWTKAYGAINAANLAITGIPKVPEAAFPTSTARNELIGEARFLRGYFYSIILLNYCLWWDKADSPYGVVYRDQTTDVSNVHQPRISVGESWNKIMEDIDFGIANMSDKFNAKTASKFFAKAYKAKLLLIRGAEYNSKADLDAAKALIDECIAKLPTDVAIQGDMKEHFSQSWDSKENIFVRYLEDDAKRTSNAGYNCEYGLVLSFGTKCVTTDGVEVPQSEAVCGIQYGLNWMRSDPRWYVSTGKARHSETWNEDMYWTWTKIYRKGRVAGKLDPVDEKYAVYLMRVPELYIMQAELRARTGASLADAVAPINTFRAKRTNPVLDPIPTPATTEELWDVIFQEYCKELFLENGAEYFASLRIQKNGQPYMVEIKGANFTYNSTKRQFPVPNSEMINNRKITGMQNPGQE